jgi:molybdopterin-guanine dinucleotide biosynthesis protein A
MEGVTVIIVCGGRSGRMGRDKKFISLNRSTFLGHAIDIAREMSRDVILVVGSKEEKEATEAVTDLPIHVDEIQGVGPLMGILTGLKHIHTEYGVILPVDTPFLKPALMKYLISLKEGYHGVVPEDRGHLEPLHGVYHREAMKRACQETLAAGKRSTSMAVRRLKRLRLVPVEELRVFDPGLRSFKSINTPEDLALIKEGMD